MTRRRMVLDSIPPAAATVVRAIRGRRAGLTIAATGAFPNQRATKFTSAAIRSATAGMIQDFFIYTVKFWLNLQIIFQKLAV